MDNPITKNHIDIALSYTSLLSKKKARMIFVGITLMLKVVNKVSWIEAINTAKVIAMPNYERVIPKEWRDK